MARRASGVRPADYPPPFRDTEAISAPTDAPDERIDVGILIVGGGPGGLACAIRLGQLLEESPDVREPPRRRPRGGAREGETAGVASALRRRHEPPRDTEALRRPDDHRGDADLRTGPPRGRLPADEGRLGSHPAATHDDEPRQLGGVRLRARPISRGAGRGGRRDDPPRDDRAGAAARARPRGRRAHGRQGPGQGRRTSRELRARRRRDGEGDRPRGGHSGPSDERRDRPVRPSGAQPADLGARREGGLEGPEAARPDRAHDGLAAPQERPLRRVRRLVDLPDGRRPRLARVRRRPRVRRRRALWYTISCRSSRRTGSSARS